MSSIEPTSFYLLPRDNHVVKDVWSPNVREELRAIRHLIATGYNHISVVVIHPGNVRQTKAGEDRAHGSYPIVKKRVDIMPPFQIACTLFDASGRVPDDTHASWQFNLKLTGVDEPGIRQLLETAAVDLNYDALRTDGVDCNELYIMSLFSHHILSERVTWIGFNAVYDFTYLTKILTSNRPLPDDGWTFMNKFQFFFRSFYDVRCLMTVNKDQDVDTPLDELANRFDVGRAYGAQFAAADDSRLIGDLFFKMKTIFFNDVISCYYRSRIYDFKNFEAAPSTSNAVPGNDEILTLTATRPPEPGRF